MNEEYYWEKMEAKIEENKKNNIDGQKLSSINTTNQNEEKAENIVSKPHLPPVPVNSFQFLNDWNEITPYLDLRYQYLKVSKFNFFQLLSSLFIM